MQDNAKTNASEEARQRRNARERAKRASETEAQKEERQRKRREKDRARRRLETSEKNANRLECMSALKRQKLAAETQEERATRLALQRERLAAETHEERAARLERMSALQRERLAAESEEERATRLANKNVHSDEHLPLLERQNVRSAMRFFHDERFQLAPPVMKNFLGLKVNSQSECLRCSRDKQVPKLYSAMHPGPTPTELQVSVLKLYLARRDAHFSSDASDVHLSTSSWTVWL